MKRLFLLMLPFKIIYTRSFKVKIWTHKWLHIYANMCILSIIHKDSHISNETLIGMDEYVGWVERRRRNTSEHMTQIARCQSFNVESKHFEIKHSNWTKTELNCDLCVYQEIPIMNGLFNCFLNHVVFLLPQRSIYNVSLIKFLC